MKQNCLDHTEKRNGLPSGGPTDQRDGPTDQPTNATQLQDRVAMSMTRKMTDDKKKTMKKGAEEKEEEEKGEVRVRVRVRQNRK